jgi:hypothetical protein
MKISRSNQQFSIMFGDVLSYCNTVGISDNAFSGMKGMIGIMVFYAARQLIPKQFPYISVHDYQPGCMRLIT